jgi:histidyl-tRNA synthetase
MNDFLPTQTQYWLYLEEVLRQVAGCYGYSEIRFPLLEMTTLFKRTIGAVTDIVEKEMYTFLDRNGESISLRPEGTAGCVRAGIQHGLFYNQQQRLWYLGPMFRYERPQQGRFRQFFQFGVEAFGMPGPDIDVEQILMSARIWNLLGLKDQVKLEINSLGNSISREKYRQQLVAFFNENIELLDEDSRRRLQTNPLRILDSKNPDMQLMLSAAPNMIDYLDDESRWHFEKLIYYLKAADINYTLNPRIVRGLDYYNMTVYEWVTDSLGAQGTVCAGGRYDCLVEHLGGKPTPAVGFAMGLERVVTLLESVFTTEPDAQVYMIIAGSEAVGRGIMLAEKLHTLLPEIRIVCDYSSGSLKSQFRKADKSGAKIALIMGEEEIKQDAVSLKYLRESRPQRTVPTSDLPQYLLQALVE